MAIKCHFDVISPDNVAGWAWDPQNPEAAIEVEVRYRDRAIGAMAATTFRPDLERAQYRGGHCAFNLKCPPDLRIEDPAGIRGLFRYSGRKEVACELVGAKLVEDGVIDFGRDGLAILKSIGLQVGYLQGRQKLGLETRLEAPLAITGRIVEGSSVQVGAFTGFYGTSMNRCSIGRYCSIAPGVVIAANEHPVDWLTSSLAAEQPQVHDWNRFIDPARADEFARNKIPFTRNLSRTNIGNDVWLGNGVFVRTGVTIGDGAIIGANSVVVSDIPAYAIAVGAPARVKRMRFDDRIIERMLALKWWKYSLYDLTGTRFDRVEEALDVIEGRVADGTLQPYRGEVYSPARLRQILADARAA